MPDRVMPMMPDWVAPFRALTGEAWEAATTDTRNLFLTAFRRLGEPFLLALDALDRGLMTRVHALASVQQGTLPIYLAKGARGNAYEIRMGSLHCSCPRFAYMAFVDEGPQDGDDGTAEIYCKHLIAASLLEYGGSFFATKCKESSVDAHDFTL